MGKEIKVKNFIKKVNSILNVLFFLFRMFNIKKSSLGMNKRL